MFKYKEKMLKIVKDKRSRILLVSLLVLFIGSLAFALSSIFINIAGQGGNGGGEATFEFFDDFSSEEVFTANKTLVSSDGLGGQHHNTISIIDKSLWVFNNSQYIAFINSNGHVVVGKRSLPDRTWSLYDTKRTVDTSDAHDVVSMGIDSDGYIHISWGMHVVNLKYARSDNPEDASSFTDQFMTDKNEEHVTYPRFFKANDILYFSYRDGWAIIGSQCLNKYDVFTKKWSALQHPLIDGGSSGVYADNFAVDNGYIHVSFLWRTSNDPITSSDYSYAYSDDGGTTWRKSNGSSYTLPITQTNAEKFELGVVDGLVNHNYIDVDGNGYPHIAYWKKASNGHVNYFHTWYNGTQWQITQLTNYSDTPTKVVTWVEKQIGRAGILINRSSNRVYIFTRRREDYYIEVFKADPPYTDWSSKKLGGDRWGWQEFGGIDYDEWHSSHTFYLMAARATEGNPAPVYILKSNLEDVETKTLSTYDLRNE